MAKLLCSITSGPQISGTTTYFNRPVNLQYVQSISIGEDEGDDHVPQYFIDFEGISVRWIFDTLAELENVYAHVINHEF